MAFLRARLDEDETAATAGVQWFSTDDLAPNDGFSRAAQAAKRGDIRSVGAWHPDRVLREVEAKRRIVEACGETLAGEDRWDPIVEGGSSEPFDLARWVLRNLAQPYDSHLDYNPAWRP